jgi:putative hemolysin
MVLFIFACGTAVLISFLCSLLEATLLSLDDVQLETRRRAGQRHARVWQEMRRRIDRPISAILILNTVAHTGGATVAGSAFDEIYGDEWIWVFSAVFTMVILLGTEIIPKVIGVSFNHRLAPGLAPVLSALTWGLRPLIAVTEWVSHPFKQKGEARSISVADLRTMADMARMSRVIGAEQENIIINATRLRNTMVKAVMVPRERMVLFHEGRSNIENFETAATTLHTRYPVSSDETADSIVGYVNFKELVAAAPSRREVQLKPFIRPLARIREELDLNDALRQLLGLRAHMALVEDGSGRVVGMLTLEDVLEELVGDLTDEFDQPSDEIIQVSASRWKVGGGVKLAALKGMCGFEPPPGGGQQTLSEWLRLALGHELRSGDSVSGGGCTVTVIQTRRRKAHRVLIER